MGKSQNASDHERSDLFHSIVQTEYELLMDYGMIHSIGDTGLR